MVHVILLVLGVVFSGVSNPGTSSRAAEQPSGKASWERVAAKAAPLGSHHRAETSSSDSADGVVFDVPAHEAMFLDSIQTETDVECSTQTTIHKIRTRPARHLSQLADLGYQVGERIPYYPSLRMELSVSWFRGSFDDVSRTLQSYFDSEPELSGLNLRARSVPSRHSAMQVGVLLRISPYVAAGIARHIGLFENASGATELKVKLSTVEARYRPFGGVVSPELAVGYGWQDVRVKQSFDVSVAEDYELESVTWHGKTTGLVLGLGLDCGPETGAGLILGAKYLPFSSIPSELAAEVTHPVELGSIVPRDTEMRMWVVTCGLRFNY